MALGRRWALRILWNPTKPPTQTLPRALRPLPTKRVVSGECEGMVSVTPNPLASSLVARVRR